MPSLQKADVAAGAHEGSMPSVRAKLTLPLIGLSLVGTVESTPVQTSWTSLVQVRCRDPRRRTPPFAKSPPSKQLKTFLS